MVLTKARLLSLNSATLCCLRVAMAKVARAPNFLVRVRERDFKLSQEQIAFDEPNLFTETFRDAKQPPSLLLLHRSPELFAIVVEYLSGYEIIPLSERALPPTMTPHVAMLNLIRDAEFYGLSRLFRRLTRSRNKRAWPDHPVGIRIFHSTLRFGHCARSRRWVA